jgi:hypothetical protein
MSKSRIVGKIKWFRKGMRMKFRGIRIRFEKRNIEDRVYMREIGWKLEKIGIGVDFVSDGIRAETTMTKLERWLGSFDVVMDEPDKLIRLKFGGNNAILSWYFACCCCAWRSLTQISE